MSKKELIKKIKAEIKQNEGISVSKFMELALFDQDNGYYVSERIFGEKGDFITSPEISQIFSEIIAVFIHYKWQEEKNGGKLQLIELGPGRGVMMHDILRSLRSLGDLYNNIEVILYEKSDQLRKIQLAKLAEFNNINISHISDLNEVAKKNSFILANEFFDALPINQYEYCKNKWFERIVDLKNEDFVFSLSKNEAKFLKANIQNKEGDIFEKSDASLLIMEQLAKFIKTTNSKALIIDYGYVKKSYGDSLQAMKNHKYIDVFADIGSSDITAHVDFEILAALALKHNNKALITTQREFFEQLGFRARNNILKQNANEIQKEKLDYAEKKILDEAEMGDLFKVLYVES
ncbi:MAG: SAM-dependent methyltransferase [Rickettsiales bacterium]|nr:SAM-dependent methyltransferase [Rickettsiales bacterium]